MKAIKKILSNTLISLIIIGVSNPLLAAVPTCPTIMDLYTASLHITNKSYTGYGHVTYDIAGHTNTVPQWKISPFQESFAGVSDDLVIVYTKNHLLHRTSLKSAKQSDPHQYQCIYHMWGQKITLSTPK